MNTSSSAHPAPAVDGEFRLPLIAPRVFVPAAVAFVAFSARFLTLRDFANDHYMQLAWAQQLLLGDLPGRDFVDPGMPLTYALSALVQWAAPGPLSEAVLTITMLALAAAAVAAVVETVTGSKSAAAAAGVFCLAMQPQLYSYPKILAPAVALLLIAWYAARPSRARVTVLALWTVVAFLFRYDLGLYVAAGASAAVVIANWSQTSRALRHLATLIAAGALFGAPYLVFVQWATGISEGFRVGMEFSQSDSHQLLRELPAFPFLGAEAWGAWSDADSAASLFYLAIALVALAPVVLIVKRRQQTRDTVAIVAAAVVMLAFYDVFIMRHPVVSRIRDVATLLAVVGAWTCVALSRGSEGSAHASARRIAAATCAALIAVGACTSVWMLTRVSERIRDSSVFDGWQKVLERAHSVASVSREWPWNEYWPSGPLPAVVPYLAACTSPSDRVLLTWSAPEYYYFARRRFGAGHALFLPPRAFTTPRDQHLMIARMEQQDVPIVLVNASRRQEFARAYPEVDAYLEDMYLAAGHFTVYDGSEVTIAVRRDLAPTGVYGTDGWPCGFHVPARTG